MKLVFSFLSDAMLYRSSLQPIFSFVHKSLNRRQGKNLVLFISIVFISLSSLAQMGRRFPSEKKIYTDSISGLKITALTTDTVSDTKIYQTHPQWTSDQQYIIFRSNRSPGKSGQAYAVHEETGEIIQLTEGKVATGSLNVARLSNKLYYFKEGQLTELDIDPLIRDTKNGKQIKAAQYERTIAALPKGFSESGGSTMDANENFAYMGLRWKEDTATKYGLGSIDIKTGAFKKIMDVPFWIGHVQANPWVPGEILYCWETRGDAEQRMWLVNSDGSNNRPLYAETPAEWVTHEIWQDKDHVLFNLMGHLPRLRTKPQGVVQINVRNNEVKIFRNADGRGYWHCAGTEDGRFAVADTFTGELRQVDLQTGATKLLTTGHYPITDDIPNVHTHHTIRPDGKVVLFNSGKWGNLDLMTVSLQ